MEKPSNEYLAGFAAFERICWNLVLFAGLGTWIAIEPPPLHWLPLGAFVLVTFAVLVREISQFRRRERVRLRPPQDRAPS